MPLQRLSVAAQQTGIQFDGQIAMSTEAAEVGLPQFLGNADV